MTASYTPPAPDEGPRDWRRRRRGRRPAPTAAAPPPAGPAPEDGPPESGPGDGDERLSRPLSSLLEPALDAVGLFGAPLAAAGIIGLATGIVVVAFVESMRLYGYIDIAIGGGLLALVGLVFLSSVLAAFLSRTGRYGINTLILLAAFTGIVVVLNVISFENSSRLDVTATNQFSLSSRTQALLDGLEADIRATAFYKDLALSADAGVAARRDRVVETLEEFAARSSRFAYRIVDPDLEPEVVAEYFGGRPTGFVSETVVVENRDNGQFDVLEPTDPTYAQLEQDLVTGLYVATGQERKTVYFLAGHGERSISGAGADGYAALREGLEQENYRAAALIWSVTNDEVAVPDDAALVVIAGPSSDLPDSHARALDLYLLGRNADGTSRRENGSLIFLAEPDTPDSFRRFLALWGILLSPGYIRDLDGSVPGLPQTLNLAAFNPSDSTLEIVAPQGVRLQSVFMPGAAAIRPLADDLRVPLPLAATSANSFLIEDPGRTDPIREGENADTPGPFVPAMLTRSVGKVGTPAPLTPPPDEAISDIAVFGDSDFLSNSNYGRGGGADLFLNSANFLMGDYSLVSIRPKTLAFRELNLDRNEYDFVRFASWLFLPGVMALAAAAVWWVRR